MRKTQTTAPAGSLAPKEGPMFTTFTTAPEFNSSDLLDRTAAAGNYFLAEPGALALEFAYPTTFGEVRTWISRDDVDKAFAHGLIVAR